MNNSTVAADNPENYPLMPTYGQPPVQFVRGSGTELFDRDGNRYLDFLCGLAVTSLGHAHPAVADGPVLRGQQLRRFQPGLWPLAGPRAAAARPRGPLS